MTILINTPAIEFLERFVNRTDAHAEQWATQYIDAKTGQLKDKHGYRAIYEPVTEELFKSHLLGDITLGVYTTSAENTCRWVCWDVDDEQEEKLNKIRDWLSGRGFTSYRESVRPGRSGHLWLFFDRAIPSELVYRLGFHARFIAGISCEIYPVQERLKDPTKSPGNLVRLPLGMNRKVSANKALGLFQSCPSKDIVAQLFWFIAQPLADGAKVIDLAQTLPVPQTPKPKKKRAKTGKYKQLIDEFPDDWSWHERTGGEWVGLCPKCYEDGHDSQENNLSLNTEINVLRCHFNGGEHTFEEIIESLRKYKQSLI